MLEIPDDFFAILSHSPRQSEGRDVSHASKACRDLKARTGRSRGGFPMRSPPRLSRLLSRTSIGRSRRSTKLAFERGNPRLQRLVLLAREPRHILDRLEFLALDDVEVSQDFFGLVAPERIDLALDALGGAG